MLDKIPLQKGTTVFLVLLAVACLGSFAFLFPTQRLQTERVSVFSGWRYGRDEMKTAGSTLAKAGLNDYQWDEGILFVPKSAKEAYESALAENLAFPKAPSDIKREALREMSQFESTAKMKLRDLYSAGWQLEQTIAQFTNKIGYATVGVRCRTEQQGLTSKNVVTASIGVWPKEDDGLTQELLSAITVATRHHLGITDDENISILDLRNGRSWLGTSDGIVNDPRLRKNIEEPKRSAARLGNRFSNTTFVSYPTDSTEPPEPIESVSPIMPVGSVNVTQMTKVTHQVQSSDLSALSATPASSSASATNQSEITVEKEAQGKQSLFGKVDSWLNLNNRTSWIVLAVALFGLFVLVRSLSKEKVSATNNEALLNQTTTEKNEANDARHIRIDQVKDSIDLRPSATDRFRTILSDYPEDVGRLVLNHPEQAARIIHKWIRTGTQG